MTSVAAGEVVRVEREQPDRLIQFGDALALGLRLREGIELEATARRLDVDVQAAVSMLAPHWVLTAAHCTDGEQASGFKVVLGRTKLSSADGWTFGVDEIVQNPAYKTDQAGGHDVSLLHLDGASDAQPLALVAPSEAAIWAPAAPVRVIGWGSSVFMAPATSDASAKPSFKGTVCRRF